jgi:hypothetical protein
MTINRQQSIAAPTLSDRRSAPETSDVAGLLLQVIA